MKIQLNHFGDVAIQFDYKPPSSDELMQIRHDSAVCVIQGINNILPANVYYTNKLKGTSPLLFTRQAVFERLKKVANALLPHYGLFIFDAFRTIETQTDLFYSIFAEIREKHPDWSHEAVEKEAKIYAAHPNEPSRFMIPPHNSGGAIDLAIYDARSKKVATFGTAFDAIYKTSRTDFFESSYAPQEGFTKDEWSTIRHNRRILFNLMRKEGFVNYPNEWWHYDLGDCLWGNEFGIEWIFPSMEEEVKCHIEKK